MKRWYDLDYSKELAKKALEIGAITLSPDDPYTWASGFRMPIYNDNRKHLRFWENRQLITQALVSILRENKIPMGSITGTSTAGIAPAASLAWSLNSPISIIEKSTLYEYSPDLIRSLIQTAGNGYSLVVSTCPHSIIPGVWLANEKRLPFAYVRATKKEHGLKQQIEGIVEKEDTAILIDFHTGESYANSAVQALEEQGAKVKLILSKLVTPPVVKPGIRIQIEDLISTGGSCVTEIGMQKGLGNTVDYCLAIFSYEFPETLEKFREAGCNVKSIFGYSTLLEVALKEGAITPEQHEMLKGWRDDPFGWGEKHGFPKVEKK